jgi:formylglycine-generating enzyme required for sulfatase activity
LAESIFRRGVGRLVGHIIGFFKLRRTIMARGKMALLLATVAVLLAGGPAGATITMEMVTVGDPGNVGEESGSGGIPVRVCGAVGYEYKIGTYEVTNAQYRAFLNSVATHEDTYGLYHAPERDGVGISQTGSGTTGDPYVYSPKDGDPNWDNRPVSAVTWYDALRFVNWLQNGQPAGAQVAGVTETGTYTFSGAMTVTVPDHASLANPTYVLPTEDEWYKAAYYKGGSTSAGYWDYATRSDTLPMTVPPSADTGNSANYTIGHDYAVGEPYWTTEVGAYAQSFGAYGTYDQSGNVRETLENFVRDSSWRLDEDRLSAGMYEEIIPGHYSNDRGFRVVEVPEPTTLLLTCLGGLTLLRRRRPMA